jgi:Family of unknown function (DUF5989)
MSVIAELFEFLLTRKKYWLIPLLALFLIFGGLLVLSQGSVVAPFITRFSDPLEMLVLSAVGKSSPRRKTSVLLARNMTQAFQPTPVHCGCKQMGFDRHMPKSIVQSTFRVSFVEGTIIR